MPSAGRGSPRAAWGHPVLGVLPRLGPQDTVLFQGGSSLQSFCGNLWSRQLPKLAAVWEGRGGGHVCPLAVASELREELGKNCSLLAQNSGCLWLCEICFAEPREPRASAHCSACTETCRDMGASLEGTD